MIAAFCRCKSSTFAVKNSKCIKKSKEEKESSRQFHTPPELLLVKQFILFFPLYSWFYFHGTNYRLGKIYLLANYLVIEGSQCRPSPGFQVAHSSMQPTILSAGHFSIFSYQTGNSCCRGYVLYLGISLTFHMTLSVCLSISLFLTTP